VVPLPATNWFFNLPFRDGNGRFSRLLLLLQCYHLGFEVGRYISLERRIEQNKERYYETLEQSSHGWHETGHDPWPYINYTLFIIKAAYREFEQRLGQLQSRDYKNVYQNVKLLEGIGLVERAGDKITVPWDIVEARLNLAA